MMKLQSRYLSEKIAGLDKKISKMPPGNIQVIDSGKYVRWYVTKDGGREYIPKRNKSFAQLMAQKKYLEYLKMDMQFDKDCIDSYLEKLENYQRKIPELAKTKFEDLLHPTIESHNEDLEKWCNSPYEKNKFAEEGLIFKNISGNIVRSKSESLIATELFINNIPFRYECILNLGDRVVFPDFTIRHPLSGEYFFWEHFGMMDKPEYAQKTADKISLYISHGIIPSINLITTYETLDNPINQLKIANIVKEYFF